MIRLRNVLILLIFIVLITLYMWGRNTPIQQSIWLRQAQTISAVIIDVLAVAILTTVSAGLGRRLAQVIGADFSRFSIPERIALPVAIGLGVIGGVNALLGLAGLFNSALILPVIVALILTFRDSQQWLHDVRQLQHIPNHITGGWHRFLLIVPLIFWGMALIMSLAPPVAWDAMTYHLLIPAHYLDAGRIMTTTDTHFFGFPQQLEMLYGLLMLITGRDTAPALMHLTIGTFGVMSISGLARRIAGDTTALLTGFLLMTAYGVWQLFSYAYVDLASLLYGATIISVLLAWRDDRRYSWLIVAGLLAGFALGTKYTNGGLILSIALFVTVTEPRRFIQNGLIAGVACLIAFAPWLLKGTLLYNNPIYPYVFDGAGWDALKSLTFNLSDRPLIETNPLQWITLPISAALFGGEYGAGFGFTSGPWLLTLPFGLIILRRYISEHARRHIWQFVMVALPMLIFWYGISAIGGIGAQPRLVMALFPVMALLAALTIQALEALPASAVNVGGMFRALLVLVTVITGLQASHTFTRSESAAYLAGATTRDDYLLKNLGAYYNAVHQLDEHVPAGATVRFMWEPKGYYCPPTITCLTDTLFDHWAHPQITTGISADDLMNRWRDAGEYLLIYGLDPEISNGYTLWLEVHDFFREQNEKFPQAVETHLTPIWTDGFAYTLYEFR